MTLSELIIPFLLQNGTIGLKPNNPVQEDNPHLFTATFEILSDKLEEASLIIKYHTGYLNSCWYNGFYLEKPENDLDPVSHDEYIGITSINTSAAKNIVKYGLKNNWCFNNHDPLKFSFRHWHYRFLYPVPYYMFRAGITPNPPDQILFALKAYTTTKKEYGDTSTKCLFYLMSHFRHEMPYIMRKACEYFLLKMEKQYGDVGLLYQVYFGATHPFTVVMTGKSFFL